MKITDIQIFQYRLPLSRPFVIAGESLDHREGLIIQLNTDDGKTGLGEIAPLPGLSEETLKKALHQIKILRAKVIGLTVPSDFSGLKKFFSSDFFLDIAPSVRFGVQMAISHAVAQDKNSTLAEMFGCTHTNDVSTAGLLQGTLEEVEVQARDLVNHGYTTFKLKVGNKNIPLDIKKVNAVRSVIGSQCFLRLDANRAWSLVEAVTFAQNAGRQGIEFIEEPVHNLSDIETFSLETKFPVALDESLNNEDPAHFILPKAVELLVIKPMILGLLTTLDWIARAGQEGKRVVVSSSFESDVGRIALANLALLTSCVPGLGTGDWFKENLFKIPVISSNGIILKTSLRFGIQDIKMNRLVLVE